MDTLAGDPPPRAPKPAQLQRVTFRTSRLLDFCSEKELTAQTGHDPKDWPLVIVKELVDNALDACEEARIAPSVSVTVDPDGIEVTDNGPGLPPKTVKDILDYAVRVSSREAYVSPTRGAQGNALKTILAMPFVLDRKCGRVEIEAKGVRHIIDFAVDHILQEPALKRSTEPSTVKNGTMVRVRWPSSASSILADAKARFLQVADDFSWLNPHLTLTTDWLGERNRLLATTPAWKKWGPSDPTSPHWYHEEQLGRLIAAYLSHDRDNGRERTVRELIAGFRGLSGTAKQKALLDSTGLFREPLSRMINDQGLDSNMIRRLLEEMKAGSRPVKAKDLGVIGEEHLRRRFKAADCEMESFQYHKILDDGSPRVRVIEVAFGWCPTADRRRLVTGVNWSAAIRNPFRQLGDFGQSLDSLLAQQRMGSDEPTMLVLHIAQPLVQYTDRGKSAVVTSKAAAANIIAAVEKVTKKWTKQRKAEERDSARERRRRDALTHSTHITIKRAAWDIMEQAYLRASDNGRLPALARQIMYAARSYIQEQTGRFLDDVYFTQTLLPDYLNAHRIECSDWNVAWDERGHLREPHTAHEVALGTLAVRDYLEGVASHTIEEPTFDVCERRYPTFGPKHRYGDILFIEKEGFLPLLEAVQIDKRYDIALMSTKGMSVVAARRLADSLCEGRRIRLLAVHDFDKSGFSILGSLRRNNRRYAFENDIEVVDLGLRLGDIDRLEREATNIPTKELEAAALNMEENGATPEEIEFLLEERVELNAFTSDALVAWIENKLVENGVEKIIPDDETLTSAYRRASEHIAVQKMIDEAVIALRETLKAAAVPADLRTQVEEGLAADPTRPWDSIVMELAKRSGIGGLDRCSTPPPSPPRSRA